MAKKQIYRNIYCVEDDEEQDGRLFINFMDQNGVPLSDERMHQLFEAIIAEGAKNRREKKHAQPRIPSIKTIEKQVLQSIIGQDKQVRQILTAIYRAKKFKDIKSNVLIMGKSGTGKTETIKQIAKKLKLPYTIEDATKYTQEGYVGASVEDMIYNLIDNADYDFEKAQNGIIVIDEIDKKHSNESFFGPDVSGDEVLKSMLKMIEGTVIKLQNPNDPFGGPINFNTENLIIIFSGAFAGLDKIKNRREKNPLGFDLQQGRAKPNTLNSTKTLKKYLIEYGMPEEFVGRIDTIITMNNLGKKDLISILQRSNLSIFRRYERALNKKGIVLEYDSKLFELIAEEALTVDTGARELSNVVNFMFENIVYEILASSKKYKKCHLLLDIVKDNTKFVLE